MTSEIMELADRVIAKTYKRFPLVLTQGAAAATLVDTEGRSYTDFVAGIAVCNLGHSHDSISRSAISAQAQTLTHVSNLYYTVPQVELAAWLVEHSFADRVFFCNSGAEANEAAIKLARKYFNDRGENNRFQNHYHGTILSRANHGNPVCHRTGQD